MTWALVTLLGAIVLLGMDMMLHLRLLTRSCRRLSDLVWMALAGIVLVMHVVFDVIG